MGIKGGPGQESDGSFAFGSDVPGRYDGFMTTGIPGCDTVYLKAAVEWV